MENKKFKSLSNRRGYAFQSINSLLNHWLESWNKSHPLLDIGCGDCTNAHQALEGGMTLYCTESEQESVKRLSEAYKDNENISFHYLHFPNQVPFEDGSFSGILCSEVFHFLDHSEVIASVWELYRLVIPGGKVVVTCGSEDMEVFQRIGLTKMKTERRQKCPLRLDAVHNYFDFLKKAVDSDGSQLAQEIFEDQKVTVKTYFNFFNPDQLAEVFRRFGFEIEVVATGPAPYYPLWEHGDNDQVRIVAKRPLLPKAMD